MLNRMPVVIKSLNINGDLVSKMLCPEFQSEVSEADITLFQETHLLPDQHETLCIPRNYDVFSLPRKYKKLFKKPFGGVAAVVSHSLKAVWCKEISSPDIMVLSLNNSAYVINAYILPEYKDWSSFTDHDPFERLEQLVATLSSSGVPIYVLGDLNA